MILRVGIIGAGLIGHKRAAHLSDAKLIAVTDIVSSRAQDLATSYHAAVEPSWQSLVQRKDIDAIIVATTHESLVECSIAGLANGKHVLVEKPSGRYTHEIERLQKASQNQDKILRVGFNHRFHPTFQEAKDILKNELLGPLLLIRARYGHGGRLGYEKEWRADPHRSGGGELLDQGVHLIDLCRWLGGEFELEWGKIGTYFWDMPVEDNGFLCLKSNQGNATAWLHASCTEWKNLFDFEIFTRSAKLQIFGLGGSYGPEELRIYRMKPEMGSPDLETRSYPQSDTSWSTEFKAFVNEIKGERTDIATIQDAYKAVQIVEKTYKLSSTPSPSCNA